MIAPWKVELVRRYFSKESPGSRVPVRNLDLKRKEKSNFAGVISPPQGDPQTSLSIVGQRGVEGFQDADAGLTSSSNTNSPLTRAKMVRGEGDVSSSSSKPVPVQCRPKIIMVKSKFPIKRMVQDEKDQGRNCVSVILKQSSHFIPSINAAAKKSRLSERLQGLKDLASRYPVKYEGKSENSELSEARLDFCFLSAKDARLFFGKVNDLFRAEAHKKTSVIMYAEESLGRFALIFFPFLVMFYLQVTSIHQS